MRSPTAPLPVTDEQRSVLEKLIRSHTAPHRDVQRAMALLMASDGFANTRIASEVGVAPMTVKAWRERFSEDGLKDFSSVRPGRGRKPSIPAEKVEEIVRLTLHETPVGETHWSCRTMAARAGVSPATVQRIWSARGLQPHRVETFKLSNDPRFEEKLVDVVGLYLNPPENAIVLCMDEKSQIQALGPHAAVAADQARAGGDDDPRLQAPRHHDAVRRAGRPDRLGDRPVPAPSPPRRVLEVPAHDRSRGSQTPSDPSDPRQLRHPQPPQRQGLAR